VLQQCNNALIRTGTAVFSISVDGGAWGGWVMGPYRYPQETEAARLTVTPATERGHTSFPLYRYANVKHIPNPNPNPKLMVLAIFICSFS